MPATTIGPLFAPTQLTNAMVSYYTAGVATRVDKMTVSNPDAAAHWVKIEWVPSGSAPGTGFQIQPQRFVQPNEVFDVWGLIGHDLAPGDQIYAQADASAVLNFFASGTRVSQ